jgi:hypothetical protein
MRPLDIIRVGAPAEEPAATNRRYDANWNFQNHARTLMMTQQPRPW